MIFQSKHIKGHGRGKHLGYPTINLEIPKDLSMDTGVYAAWVEIKDKTYKGALHYGPTLTFGDKTKSLEVYLLDVMNEDIPETINVPIGIDIVTKLRDVERFNDADSLVEQIGIDVKKVRIILG